jgi:hypothetical protein
MVLSIERVPTESTGDLHECEVDLSSFEGVCWETKCVEVGYAGRDQARHQRIEALHDIEH